MGISNEDTLDGPPHAEHLPSGTFSSLGNQQFRMIWVGGTLSHLGTFVHLTAAAWLMTTLTSSSTLIALVQSAWALPTMLLALVAGATADIYDKRTQMIVSMAFCSLSIFILLGVFRAGALEPWSLLALMVTMGVGAAFFFPAWQASLPEIVSKDQFVSAVSLNNFSFNVARCIGPGIAGEILVRSGVGAAFVINGMSCLFLIWVLYRWKREKSINSWPKETVAGAIGDGLRYARLSPKMLKIVACGFVFPVSGSAILALTPLVALELDGQPRTLGMLLLGFGVGAMAGALSVTWLQAKLALNRLAFLSAIIVTLALWALSIVEHKFLAAGALLLGGFGWVQIMSILQILIQTSCPRWVVGRMVSLLAMVFSAGIAIGAASWGSVADIVNTSTAFHYAAIATGIAGALLLALPLNQVADGFLGPQSNTAPPFTQGLVAGAGPIKTSVEYKVSSQNIDAFKGLMLDVGRIRKRDGARGWRFHNDSSIENLWIEEFQSPTWAHHLRLTARSVKGDLITYKALTHLCDAEPTTYQEVGDSEETFIAPVPGIQLKAT